MNNVIAFIKKLSENREIFSYSEDEIKQSVILPLLQLLGWNIFDVHEVNPEYSLQAKRVDYALILKKKALVFVEAKRPSVQLENCQEQLLTYAFTAGVRHAVLTNGINWWFYLPLREGSWEKRRYFSINIFDQKPEEAAKRFNAFMNKSNVLSGSSERNAKSTIESKSRSKGVAGALPIAWRSLISEPDEILIELLKDKVADLSGYTPNPEELMDFFSKIQIAENEVKETNEGANENKRRIIVKEKNEKKIIKPRPISRSGNSLGQDDMEHEILLALHKLGGRAYKKRVEDFIYDKYKSEMAKEWYQESVAHGVERWKHNIAWAKEKLKHQNLIKPPAESGRGVWELTHKGKERINQISI